MEYDEDAALKLCAIMKETALSACRTEEEKAGIQDMTIAKLEDMGLLCMLGRDYAPTHTFNLMTVNRMKHAKIQCALFKGTEALEESAIAVRNMDCLSRSLRNRAMGLGLFFIAKKAVK